MTDDHIQKALDIAKAATAEAGTELSRHFGTVEAMTKGNTGQNVADVVTELDRQTELFLEQEFRKFDPTIAFRGEEFGVRAEADRTWLVDPIDGTGHFVRGLPFCTTMVALIENNQVIMSVIYDFVRMDMYWAIKGQGAYRNDERLQVSNRPLSKALISFETRLDNPHNLAAYLRVQKTANTIHTVNCGFEFAMIAVGKLEGRIGLNPYGEDWDFAPGSLLVTEAGGIAANIGEAEYDYRNHDYIIANPIVYNELTSGDKAVFPRSHSDDAKVA